MPALVPAMVPALNAGLKAGGIFGAKLKRSNSLAPETDFHCLSGWDFLNCTQVREKLSPQGQ
jgi:hypothetical protein